MRRFLALLGALAMVGGAILVRGAIDDASGGGSNDGKKMTLLCAAELETVCDELHDTTGIRIATAPMDGVASNAELADYDGWLTFERNTANSAVAPLLGAASPVLGRSPLVLAVGKERGAVLEQQCGGEITWRCVGDAAGSSWASIGGEVAWGNVKLGHADPSTSGEGLAIIGQAAQQFFGPTKNLSRDDFEQDNFFAWFTQLERAVESDDAAFEHLLTFGAARYDVVATIEALAGPQLAAAARDRRDRVRLLYPDPVATADVVFVPFIDGNDSLFDVVVSDDGRAALAHAGFRVDGEDPIAGVPTAPPLPDSSNLPDGGVLEALLQTWREVTR
ncbi:MAG: hypothetical protein EXQ79_00375 [Acidimicrobiia bacterium]|nr:hypothetical protein [Acidimicrobiia bacterium]